MKQTKSIFYIIISCIIILLSSCEKSNESQTIEFLTKGSWKYVGTYMETPIGESSPNDTKIYIPVDAYKYGTWFFKSNGEFKEVRGNDSLAIGRWSYSESDNAILFQIDSSNYITSVTPTYFTKQISSINSKSLIFETKFGTISNTIYQKEIFEQNN